MCIPGTYEFRFGAPEHGNILCKHLLVGRVGVPVVHPVDRTSLATEALWGMMSVARIQTEAVEDKIYINGSQERPKRQVTSQVGDVRGRGISIRKSPKRNPFWQLTLPRRVCFSEGLVVGFCRLCSLKRTGEEA